MHLPDRVDGEDGLVIRTWRAEDVPALAAAVTESTEHLRPWMDWIAHEPLPLAARHEQVVRWERERTTGVGAVYGIFLRDQVVGGTGLHGRLGTGGLEIGYWMHPAFVGRGIATEVSRLLTIAGLALPGIDRIEIHHDKANRASRRVPEKLGFTLLGEFSDGPEAPADLGIELQWRATAGQWSPPTKQID